MNFNFKKNRWPWLLIALQISLILLISSSYPKKYKYSATLEGGIGLLAEDYSSQFTTNGGGASKFNLSSTHPMMGLRVTGDKFFDKWFIGLTGGVRYYFKDKTHTHSSIPATAFRLKSRVKHRLELALRGGVVTEKDILLFIKGGWVLGGYHLDVRDYTFRSKKRKNLNGLIAGAGIEMPIDPGISLGATVDHEIYAKIDSDLANNSGVVGHYSTRPSNTSFMLTLTVKLN